METRKLRIHGDNIVECERTLRLIEEALKVREVTGPFGSPVNPEYEIVDESGNRFHIMYYPGFGRWHGDILNHIRNLGGRLREAADAIITELKNGAEEALLAIEYSGALSAGNQAWQRSGRAYSFSYSGVPYLYITEIGGFELDAKRQRRAARLPNPAVPFSYLALSTNLKIPALPILTRNPGSSLESLEQFKEVYGERDLLNLVEHILYGTIAENSFEKLKDNVLALINTLAAGRRRSDSLTASQWSEALEAIEQGKTLTSYLKDSAPLNWSKTAYIESLTSSMSQFMGAVSKYALGLTATNLPLCFVRAEDKQYFLADIQSIYPSSSEAFVQWIEQAGDIVICWVMGFKPKGDDARPDRGLPPLARMLVGDEADLLTVVYGPAKPITWPLLESSPARLARQNGLWEAILATSSALLADSSTLDKEVITLTRDEWKWAVEELTPVPVDVSPYPKNIGEHDVDTVLHLLFFSLGKERFFEGMCNPPGGDWSGISILAEDGQTEYRWLGLPRVTSDGGKRPDHVFQFFSEGLPSKLLVIESKETARSVEDHIGTRLEDYVSTLLSHQPSAEKDVTIETWKQSEATELHRHEYISAAAFVLKEADELQEVAARAQVDIVFGLREPEAGSDDGLILFIRAVTKEGQPVAGFLTSMSLGALKLRIETGS